MCICLWCVSYHETNAKRRFFFMYLKHLIHKLPSMECVPNNNICMCKRRAATLKGWIWTLLAYCIYSFTLSAVSRPCIFCWYCCSCFFFFFISFVGWRLNTLWFNNPTIVEYHLIHTVYHTIAEHSIAQHRTAQYNIPYYIPHVQICHVDYIINVLLVFQMYIFKYEN